MSHFSAIGYLVSTDEDYQQLLETVLPLATPHSTYQHLTYLRYTDPSGAEIWLCGDNATRSIVNMTPCFLSTTTQKVGINVVVSINNGEFGDGTAHGWIDVHEYDEESGWGDGDYPVVIDIPDYLNHTNSSQILSAHLTLFGEDVEMYADEAMFERSQEEQGLNFSSQFFAPMGMFKDEEEPSSPNATILASLKVLASEKRRNTLTNIDFYWCRVQTYGGEYEAVFPLDRFEDTPQVGSVIFGNYWLTGRFAP